MVVEQSMVAEDIGDGWSGVCLIRAVNGEGEGSFYFMVGEQWQQLHYSGGQRQGLLRKRVCGSMIQHA